MASQEPALLFDLDGTLVDSVYQHVIAWRAALEGEGLDLSTWRIHRRVGMSGGLLVNALGREIGQGVLPGSRWRRCRPGMPVASGSSRRRSGRCPGPPSF